MRLESEPDLDVIAEAADGSAAVDLAARLEPSVVLMDVEMPRMGGIDATREIRRQAPDTAIIVLSVHDDPMTIGEARTAGATAFIAKHQPSSELIAAIREAAETGGIMTEDQTTDTGDDQTKTKETN